MSSSLAGLATREISFSLKDSIYPFGNKISLFTSIKIIRIKSAKISLSINGVDFNPTETTKKYWVWDIKTIRDKCRDILFPEDDQESNMKRIEANFVYNGLKSIQFYSNLSHDDLQNSIFSIDLDINFKLESDHKPKFINGIQTYIVSDVHK